MSSIGVKRKLDYDQDRFHEPPPKALKTPEAADATMPEHPKVKRMKTHMTQLHALARALEKGNESLCLERDALMKQNKALAKDLRYARQKVRCQKSLIKLMKDDHEDYDRELAVLERKYRKLQNVLYEERCEHYRVLQELKALKNVQ